MHKQLIIVRKDLNMSVGKLAGQVAHASNMYFLSLIKSKAHDVSFDILPVYDKDAEGNDVPFLYKSPAVAELRNKAAERGERYFPIPTGKTGYRVNSFLIEKELYEGWIDDIYTKIICEAKNKSQLLKAAELAETLGLKENKDFFLIKDRCLTELAPEETDENGNGQTLTAIGFRPLDSEVMSQISRKYQLLK